MPCSPVTTPGTPPTWHTKSPRHPIRHKSSRPPNNPSDETNGPRLPGRRTGLAMTPLSPARITNFRDPARPARPPSLADVTESPTRQADRDRARHEIDDRRVVLSTLWVFVLFNYIYADILKLFFNPSLQKEAAQRLASGYEGTIHVTQGFALFAALVPETAIAMVLLS